MPLLWFNSYLMAIGSTFNFETNYDAKISINQSQKFQYSYILGQVVRSYQPSIFLPLFSNYLSIYISI